MDADFDPSKLDDIPDVLPPAGRIEVLVPMVARASAIGPARGEVARRRALALLVGLAWLGLQVVVLGLRRDLPRLGASYPLAQIALPAALSALALGAAIWPGRDGLGARALTVRGIVIGGIAGMSAVAFLWPVPFEYVPPPGTPTFAAAVLICADIVAIMGAVPLALGALVLRSAFPTAAGDRCAALGVASGLGAVTAMHLHCENTWPAHVLLGHMAPAAALVLAAALALRAVVRA